MTTNSCSASDSTKVPSFASPSTGPRSSTAFNFQMYEELIGLIDEAEEDDDVKVIILRGAGTSFGAGQDLSQVGLIYGFDQAGEQRRPSIRRRLAVDRKWAGHYSRYWECSKITLAQVHGHCLGTQFALMITSDFADRGRGCQHRPPGPSSGGPRPRVQHRGLDVERWNAPRERHDVHGPNPRPGKRPPISRS